VFNSLSIAIVFVLSIQTDAPRTFGGRTLDAWLTALHSKSSRERRAAVVAVTCFGPEAKAAVPDLIEILRNDRDGREVVQALERIGPDAAPAVPLLIERFVKSGHEHLTGMGAFQHDPSVRDALVRIGAPAMPALLEIFNGPNVGMRTCAAEALGRIGPAAGAAVPSLLRAIRPRDPKAAASDREDRIVQSYAIDALGEIGPQAVEAVPILQAMLDDKQKRKDPLWNEWGVINALTKLGSPPIEKLLDFLLRDGDNTAAYHLIRLGSKAKAAVPALRRALVDSRLDIRISAAIALAWSQQRWRRSRS
jgi:HEAT repeat protein